MILDASSTNAISSSFLIFLTAIGIIQIFHYSMPRIRYDSSVYSYDHLVFLQRHYFHCAAEAHKYFKRPHC